jgi:hypothetical protein
MHTYIHTYIHTKILSNILLPSLTLYAEGIIRDRQYGYRHNSSATDHIRVFCIRQILDKNGNTVKRCISHL